VRLLAGEQDKEVVHAGWQAQAVKFDGVHGQESIPAPGGKTVDFPATIKELVWFCGGTRQTSANDKPFNRVKISRADNGAIQWVFFRVTGSGGSGRNPALVQVGDSFDACDRKDVERAGNGHLWLWDSEKGRFIDTTRASRDVIRHRAQPHLRRERLAQGQRRRHLLGVPGRAPGPPLGVRGDGGPGGTRSRGGRA
jgi:hypothetical protein